VKPLRLLIAVVVLVALGGFVYYTEENPPADDDERVKIVDVEQDDLQEVSIARPGNDTLTVKRGEDEKWQFAAPSAIPADDSAVGSMLNSVSPLQSDRMVQEEVTDWTPFGLEGDGTLRIDLKAKEDKSYRVIFGSDTPTGSGVFARLDGDPRLFTVYSYVKSGFEKEVFDLRDKKLLRLDGEKISRVVVKVGERTLEFGKSGDDAWQILEPKPLRADNFTVGDLVRAVENGEMSSVLAEASQPANEYSFQRPLAVVEVTDESGVHTLTIAKDKADKHYAKSSDLEGVYEVSSTLAEALDKPLDDFRNKKLFDFGFTDPAAIQVRDGETRLNIAKKDDQWILSSDGDRELESEKVQALLDDLRALRAESFPSDDESDQGKYGLTDPAIEAEVIQAGDGGTEKVVLSSPAEEKVYGARVGQSTTYELEKSDVEDLRKRIEDLTKQEEPGEESSEQE
jgi:hypothetical protein